MIESTYTRSEFLTIASVVVLVFMIWCMAVLGWWMRRDMQSRRLRRRVGIIDEKRSGAPTKTLSLWREGGEQVTTVVPHSFWWARFQKRLERIPQEVGWDVSVYLMFAGMSLAILILFGGTWVFTNSALSASGVAIMGGTGFIYYLQYRRNKRHATFERQFEEAMNLVARSLRAGQPLLGSFQLVAEEMDPPISSVFHDICQQQALGLSLEEAIRRVSGAYNDKDLSLFATSVVIQLRTGGNLADMMNRLASILRDRLKLLRRVRVLTAQTQYSKRVLLIMPVVMFVLLTAMRPDYMEPMYETSSGRYLSALAIFMMLVGTFVMNRMAKVEY